MAAAGDYIFSQPLTITGSIGVVVMIPNVEQLAEKLSISFKGVGTHPFGGTFSIGHQKNPEEMQQIRKLAGKFYVKFVGFVAEQREMTFEEVRELPGPRTCLEQGSCIGAQSCQ